MRYLISLLIIWAIFLAVSCNSGEQATKENHRLFCLKESDSVLNIKIVNTGTGNVYIPDDYMVSYTHNTDTIHLEAFDNPKYKTEYFYRYKTLFPFDVYTAKKIQGVMPDSVLIFKESISYNQFKVRQLTLLKPDSTYYRRLKFNIPGQMSVVTAVIYSSDYSGDERMRKQGYSVEDFMNFENKYASYLACPVIDGFYK